MPRKRWAQWAALTALMASTGCCRFCDRWCPERQQAAGYPQPQCCVPCGNPAPVCPPGTVPANYAPGYQATYAQPANNCCR